jgi:hypothetical protein
MNRVGYGLKARPMVHWAVLGGTTIGEKKDTDVNFAASCAESTAYR